MMLDVMRKHSRSFIIYIFFGIIIAVFVVNFGPQSAGCTTSVTSAARVGSKAITPSQFNYTLTATGILSRYENLPEHLMVRLRGSLMDQLLVREILADDAHAMGFRIPDKEIEDNIVKGRFTVLGQTQPLILDDDGNFVYDQFARWVKYRFGLTVKNFMEDQRRELLAEKLRRVLRDSVKISEEEVKFAFIHENTKVNLEYVAFRPGDYRPKVQVTEEKITTFLASNKKKVEEYFKANKTAYEKLPPQVQLQVLKLAIATPESKAEVRAKAEELHRALTQGGDFTEVARRESSDVESRERGGLLGWRNEDSTGLGKNVDKALGALKVGDLAPVIEEEGSMLLVKVLGRRKGDLTLAQAEREIAEQLLRTSEALNLALAEARHFAERAKAGEKLADMFTTDEDAKKEETPEPPKADTNPPATPATPEGAAPGTAEPVAPPKPAKSPLKLAATEPFSRSGQHLVPGIGVSKEIAQAAFQMKAGQVAPEPFVVQDVVYLVACKERQEANLGDFTRRKQELMQEALDRKAEGVLRDYMARRCFEERDKDRLSVNPGMMVTQGFVPAKDQPPLPEYRVCGSFEPESTQGASVE